jgi:hypothetical protein
MAHGLDTNMNEAFNNICTWFAPKDKVFAGAYTLHNRIAFAVSIDSLGVLEYFVRLYRKLGITMTEQCQVNCNRRGVHMGLTHETHD